MKGMRMKMILNEEFLRIYARQKMQSTITESMENIKHSSCSGDYDIFLSHSSLDQELTCALYNLFIQNGFNVYLDYEDHELNPQNITSSTGEQLRNKLKECKCLAYISTPNIINSKWCPWELGLFDGISNGKCCILPIVKQQKDTTYSGQEYLGMYPYLSYDQIEGSDEGTFWVMDASNPDKYANLSSWLSGSKLMDHKR